MKKQLYILILIMLPVLGWGQQQSFTIQDNLNSVTILPNSIETRREGVGFDTSKHNLVLGKGNLLNPNQGYDNLAIGINVLENNAQNASFFGANSNIGIGNSALKSNTNGSDNIGIGIGSLFKVSNGNQNIGIGTYALSSLETSSGCVAVGYNSLRFNSIGTNNTALGNLTLELNSTGTDNTSVGYKSQAKSTGSWNTSLGSFALGNDNNGVANIAIGYQAMKNNTSGTNNVAVGLSSIVSNVTGGSNITVGNYTLALNIGGNRNTALGESSLYANVYGSNNVAVGYEAGYNETGSDKLYIENSNSSTPLIGGDFANDIVGVNMPISSLATNPTWKLQVGGDINASGSVRAAGVVLTSDVRFKKNIEPLTSALGQVMQLRGVSYYWNQSKFPTRNFTERKQMGLIAQEIEKIFPEIVETDAEGYKSVNYVQLTPVMIEAIKELNNKIENLEKQNLELKASISGIYEMLDKGGNTSHTATSKHP